MTTAEEANNQPVDLPPDVVAFCHDQGYGSIESAEQIKSGMISLVHRLTTASGTRFVIKQRADAPQELYALERESLDLLRDNSTIRMPAVYLLGTSFILLEDLNGAQPVPEYWQLFGRSLALQHAHTNDRFGFDHDNILGLLPQRNPWTSDGHDFFAAYRILNFLEAPPSDEALSASDRRAIERFASRLRDFVPAQPAALLHGDLWTGNMLVGPEGEPAAIDPAVYYGWPEAELAMVRQYGEQIPQAFYHAYIEVHPLEDGWWQRLELLFIREWLSVIAHFGDKYGTVAKVRELIKPYV